MGRLGCYQASDVDTNKIWIRAGVWRTNQSGQKFRDFLPLPPKLNLSQTKLPHDARGS